MPRLDQCNKGSMLAQLAMLTLPALFLPKGMLGHQCELCVFIFLFFCLLCERAVWLQWGNVAGGEDGGPRVCACLLLLFTGASQLVSRPCGHGKRMTV